MKISYSWLRQLVATDLSVEDLAHPLTMSGLEVEEITPVAADFTGVVVAEVKTVTPHPNADKLRVTEVDAGTGTLLQIVCGAPNVAVGMRVPCAMVGAKLPGIDIKAAKLRGVESAGMLCSARELGLSEDHGGLLALAADAPIGEDIRKHLDLNDVYFTLKLTPNRGDCLSVNGIARDLAATLGSTLKLPAIEPVAATCDDQRAIKISAPEDCGRYCGRVIRNINTRAATPEWMKRRLERSGFRSISPLVDITNYMILECGGPMHAFDQDKLQGGIDVRMAKPGEEMNLLNAQHVVLKPGTLIIADASGPVAMAGVMGGLESMVTDTTTSVFFEAAYFDPDTVRGRTRELGINSDAAYRFERGVDPESRRANVEYATRLTLDICGTPATQVGPLIEATGKLPARPQMRVRPARAEALIGMPIPVAAMRSILERLQCKVAEEGSKENAALLATPPSHRFDLTLEEDFIEEIARIHGYEKVPAVPPHSSVPILHRAEGGRTRTELRHQLADRGYQEIITYSFVPDAWESDFAGNTHPVRLVNPISSQMSVMRTTLLGGLIQAMQHNLNRGEVRMRLFEIGRCFLSAEATYEAQPEKIAGAAIGARYPEQWAEDKSQAGDFFDIKGDVEQLLAGLAPVFAPVQHPALHPGRSASVSVAGKLVGFVGELHPRWQQNYDLPTAVCVFELDAAVLMQPHTPVYEAIARTPATRRDIAVLADENTPVQALIDTVWAEKIAIIIDFSLFDHYRGDKLPNGKKSLAFRIVMQDTDRTLTDSDVDQATSKIVDVLHNKHGVTLRI